LADTKEIGVLKALPKALILAFALACKPAHEHSPGSTRSGVRYFDGVGQYLFHATEGSQTTVTLNHEEIPGFMDAMAMPYLLQDTPLLTGLEAGQDIEFRVVAEEDGFYFVDRITPTSAGSRSPVRL
jgi:Cu/Ag efflux protein CusF